MKFIKGILLIVVFSSLVFLSSCIEIISVLLNDNRIPFDDNIAGVWKIESENDGELISIKKKDDYYIWIKSLKNENDVNGVTLHRINGKDMLCFRRWDNASKREFGIPFVYEKIHDEKLHFRSLSIREGLYDSYNKIPESQKEDKFIEYFKKGTIYVETSEGIVLTKVH